ncbi:retinoid-inducible serine carboxypeptidase-like [Schistocerca cancellata]|uniref:retinoid-inducible serine carboxypeptidase-like n=1 Tax=Schistocerca cancellata TaxID=274614 RepID=UPI0021188290|nr:retinoid-inducible serine carboxypeptidase-like [Schistocerca cancellata]
MSFLSVVSPLVLLFVAACSGRQGVGPGEQDWGYIDVRDGAHMFYWLYYTTATTDYATRPLVIWLQGGPGASGTGYGNFEELGIVDTDLNVRNSSWVHKVNVLFIDNPVGTGYSYVDSNSLYTTTNAEIAADLLTFIKAFVEQYPTFQTVPLYIFSESYGGKMASEFALELYKAIQAGEVTVPLRGVAMGDSWISPIDSVLTWAPFLLQTGMIDSEGYAEIDRYAQLTNDAVNAGNYGLATSLWSITENVILSVTSNIDFYNILYKVNSYGRHLHKAAEIRGLNRASDEELNELMNGYVRNILGDVIPADVSWGSQSTYVSNALNDDFMKPVTDVVESLLNETDIAVVVYTGNLDLIVDTPGTLKWVENLKWAGAQRWEESDRSPIMVNGIIEGYYKKYDNFAFYWITRSGHMVPTDNPDGALWVLKDVTQYE